MLQPYQHLAVVSAGEPDQRTQYLVASTADRLRVASIHDGSIKFELQLAEEDLENTSNGNDHQQPPAKKQKTANNNDAPKKIIDLASTTDCNALVVVSEDKTLHVYDVDKDGQLFARSRRSMPKRPCAIRILVESQLILCGDKFGDVYSLPLYPDPAKDAEYGQSQTLPRNRRLAADSTTVHTKRNQTILEAQQKQTQWQDAKAPLTFEHKLLLGHVSMLTDMIFVKHESNDGRGRIITADRDEHIRVSRSPVQAHVIEGYCLAHREFVSKLCAIPNTTLFASGGGDDTICIWDWSTCQQLFSIDIHDILASYATSLNTRSGNFTISGIWHHNTNGSHLLLVACERVPALLTINLNLEDMPVMAIAALQAGFPIDAVSIGSSVIVSVDSRTSVATRLHAFKPFVCEDGAVRMCQDDTNQTLLESLNAADDKASSIDDKTLDEMMYNLSNLRKRGAMENQENDDE